jgi:hypothetical protein
VTGAGIATRVAALIALSIPYAKSETAKAIDYAENAGRHLTRFLDHGHLCMFNNTAERQLRSVAVGRRNWTFAGSDEGGRRRRKRWLS